MRKLCKKALFLTPIPIAMVAVCLDGDPAHLFRQGRYERRVASIMLEGKNAAGVSNYDERLVQRYYAEGVSRAKDVLVLGSSRSMGIPARLFPGRSFFNCSVSGASLEDLIAIYQLHRSRGHLPHQVVVGLDPWLLNRNNGQSRWKTLAKEYHALAAVLEPGAAAAGAEADGASLSWKRYTEALSPDYFRQSLKALLKNGAEKHDLVATGEVEGEPDIKAADGSLRHNRRMRTRPGAAVDADAIGYAKSGSVYSLEGFDALDPARVNMLEKFVRLLQKDGAEVTFFLAPYHPESYRRIAASPRYRMLLKAEAHYRGVALAHGVTVRGSYDPAPLGLRGGDFLDGMHPTPEATARVLLAGAAAPSKR